MYSKLLKLNRTSLRKIYRSFYTEIFTSQLPLDKKFLLAAEPKKMRIKLYLSKIFNIKCGIFCSHMIILLLFEFVLSKHCLIWSSKYCILSIIFFFHNCKWSLHKNKIQNISYIFPKHEKKRIIRMQ